MNVLLILSKFVVCLLFLTAKAKETLDFEIRTLWNGTEIDHPPVKVSLSNNNGDLDIDVRAPFFNSPIVEPSLLADTCPNRPFFTLWDYEVVEAFFLNDKDEYLEVEISPEGKYLILLLNGVRNAVLWNLPLFPNGVTYENECLASQDPNCKTTWKGKVTIPREYLPPNVSKFNAFAIHGRNRGEKKPESKDIVYQALYPVDPEVVENPNFHYLEAFQPIDLGRIGMEPITKKSKLWESATGNGDYELRYCLERTTDCGKVPPTYDASIKTYKCPTENKTTVQIQVSDTSGASPIIPDSLKTCSGLLTTSSQEDTESVWLSFSGKDENDTDLELRIGINPFGANRIELIADDVIRHTKNNNLKHVRCLEQRNTTVWTCTFDIEWELFPLNMKHFQMIHQHKNLDCKEDANKFVGAICPGQADGSKNDKIDWRGCQTDVRTVAEKEKNPTHSKIWRKALNLPE